MADRHDGQGSLVDRVAASLAGKPGLRAALAAARPRDRPRLSHLLRDDGDGIRRGILVRQRGFHLALLFGGRTSVTWRTYDGSSDDDPAEVAGGLFRHGKPCEPATGDAAFRDLARSASAAPVLSVPVVEAVEDAEDDAIVVDDGGRLSDALHLVTLAGARRRLLASLEGEWRALVAHVAGQGRDLDAGLALAIHVAAGVERPGWVLQAIVAAPLLETLLWPTGPFLGRSRELLGLVAAGASPFDVVGDMLGLPASASPALLRSAGNLPPDARLATEAAQALSRFHGDDPRHRHLDPEEARRVAEAVASLGPSIAVRHLLDGSGRVGAMPEGLRDAVASLGDSLDAISSHLPGSFIAARQARDRVAFPPSRRHASLVRIDRDWHASVGRHEAALSALRDGALSAGVAIPEGEYPHLVREGAAFGGVTVAPLLTRADYLREGAAMGHCVASHAGRAWAARQVGFSLRDGAGGRSTMTVDVAANGLSQVRHKGVGNAPPPGRHEAAVDALLRSLRADHGGVNAMVAVARARAHAARDATTLPRGAAPELVRCHLGIHFANVSHWLAPSEVAMGVDAWWATVVGARAESARASSASPKRLVTGSGS